MICATKHSTVSGQLIPNSGLIKMYAPQTGIIIEQHVKEGQLVRAGEVLYVLSSERHSSTLGATKAAISRQVESVAIIGPSGGSKTTLINILLGILVPTQGEVLIGGQSVNQIGLDTLRRMIGTVLQDDVLFAGSLADNISFFDPQADHTWIAECARMAAIDLDIAAMPMGYNTLVGDMGTILSGGQKQRVLLARALYKRPQILFLDEATSHLDIECEHLVNAAIKSIHITRVVVAHRPETINSANRVIVLAEGKVISQ